MAKNKKKFADCVMIAEDIARQEARNYKGCDYGVFYENHGNYDAVIVHQPKKKRSVIVGFHLLEMEF